MTNGWRLSLLFLVGIAAVVAAHLMLDFDSDGSHRIVRGGALVADATQATGFEVSVPGKPPLLLAAADFGRWRIERPYADVADFGAVQRLADGLAFALPTDEMTDAELLRIGRTRADLRLEPPRATVKVALAGGASTLVAFGGTTPNGDGVYAAVEGRQLVCVVPTNVFAAVCADDLTAFRSREIVSVRPEDVESFDIKGGSAGFCRIVRDGTGWKIVDPETCLAAHSRVDEFLGALCGGKVAGYSWPVGASNETGSVTASLLAAYGIHSDSPVSVVLKCRTGSDCIVNFGRVDGDELAYACIRNGKAVVSVPASLLEMVRKGVDFFSDSRLFPVRREDLRAVKMDDSGVQYLISRTADGGWRLESPIAAPADAATVEAMLDRIVTMKRSDADSQGILVSVATNSPPVSVSRAALLGTLRLDDLRSTDVLQLDERKVKRLVVSDASGKSVSALYDPDHRSWMAEGGELDGTIDPEAVKRVLGALASLKADRVVRLRVTAAELGVYGLDTPFMRIAVDQTDTDSVRRNLLVGDVTDGGRYATLGASDAVVVIPSEVVTALTVPIFRERQ